AATGRIRRDESRPRVSGKFRRHVAATWPESGHVSRARRSSPRNFAGGARSTMRFDRDDRARPPFVGRSSFRKHDQRSAAQSTGAGLARAGGKVKALFLTNEYPPHIYGGAGVHVGYLTRELAKSIEVDVRCFGDQDFTDGRLKVKGYGLDTSNFTCPKPVQSVFGAIQRCLDFNTTNIDANLVHCHTWYSHFGGILAKKNYGIPLLITTHSLEPLRPWKREQLAGGYDFSVWVEKTAIEMADAIIAVSNETKADIERLFDVDPKRVHVIHNGIDLDEYRKVDAVDALKRQGIDPNAPYLLFVGRITRQKGIIHLVRAIEFMDP